MDVKKETKKLVNILLTIAILWVGYIVIALFTKDWVGAIAAAAPASIYFYAYSDMRKSYKEYSQALEESERLREENATRTITIHK